MKRKLSILSIILSILIVFSSISMGSVNAADIPGDANKDSAINLQDVLWVRKYLVKLEVPRRIKAGDPADVNKSGAMDTDDVFQLRRYIAKLQKEFYERGIEIETTTKPTTSTTSHNYAE
ncbi:MAG: dockerin type I repeat-containing protein, partial [Clostridia bacterium]|nr:dockerin type I repeat-containing protein [Clostridia bacterium]